MKILVTGSAGFIGHHLVVKLLEMGNIIVGIDNINDYYDVNLKYDRLEASGILRNNIFDNISVNNGNYTFYKMDLADKANLMKLFKREKFDVVVNLAAQAGVRFSIENPHAYTHNNIDGFLNLLEACRAYAPSRLLYASSSSVYGLNKKQPFSTNDKTDFPASMYAVTKKTNELMAHVYSHLYGIETVGLRFFTVYGPWGRPDMAPFLFSNAIINDEKIKVFNFGNMKRDFTYIDDIIIGICKLISVPVALNFNLFNIGNGKPVDLNYFISCLENEFEKQAKKIMLKMQDGDVQETWADTTELENLIKYKPDTQIEIGVRNFVTWFKSYYCV
jgi:UDP-glucuronate 4-epimerase